MIYGKSKKFSQQLCNQHDPQSRRIVKEYLKKQGLIVNDNPNKYGVDLISEDGTLQVEIEHRLIWKEKDFPYKDINIPERKKKFFIENSVCYFILSMDYSRIGMIDGKNLRQFLNDDTLTESSNKYVREGEYFYKVPASAFRWDDV